MKLKKVIGEDQAIMITPMFDKDMPTFKHCTGGLEACHLAQFERDIVPVLNLHGVWDIHVREFGKE